MGINFYHKRKGKKKRHIGLSSCGWCFSLHVIPDKDIHTLDDWLKKLDKGKIVDEYGGIVSKEDMTRKITCRSNEGDKVLGQGTPPLKGVLLTDGYYESWYEFFNINHAEVGPNNLLRARIDGIHCIGHGKGTWDLLIGDYS